MYNPFNSKMFEIYEAGGLPDLDFKISKLSDSEIKRAVLSNQTYTQTGTWPAHETVMHDLWNEYGSEYGSEYDIPRWQAINFFYYLVCKEAANRWVQSNDQD